MANENAITLRKLNNFKANIIEFNKDLDERADNMMYIYEGNPYCHEFALNCKLGQKNKDLLKFLEEYEKMYREYKEWMGEKL